MRLAIRVLGLDLLVVEWTTEDEERGAPDYMATPVGFAPQVRDPRWEPGLEP